MADNLESFFKKHLSDESSGEDGWNMPSDSVWENALPEIQKKKGVFIPWKYLYLLGLISIVGFALVLFFWDFQDTDLQTSTNNTEIATNNPDQNQASNAITNPDYTVDEKNTQSEIIEKDNLTEESVETTSKLLTSLNNSNIEKKYRSELDEQNIVTGEVPTAIDKATIVSKDEPLGEATNQDKLAEAGTTPIMVVDQSKGTSSDKKLAEVNVAKTEIKNVPPGIISSDPTVNTADSIHQQTFEFKTDTLSEIATNNQRPDENTGNVIATTDEVIMNIEPINYKGKIAIGAYYAPTLNSTYFRGEMVSGITNTAPVFLYSGNYGMDIKYYISNKLAIVSGIGRSEIKSWSKSMVDFEYDNSTEHDMGNGEKENTSPVPMPTPFGEINTEITYRFPESDEIPDGEPMQSEQETHQDVKYLSIPLGVEYNILNRKKIIWFAEGGAGYNYALKDATEISSRIIHYGDDMTVVGEEMTSHPNYKDYYISYYIGTGLNYRLSKAINFSSSVRYMGNLTELNMQNNMSTNAHVISLKLGLVYYF